MNDNDYAQLQAMGQSATAPDLAAQLAAMTAERDALVLALKPFADAAGFDQDVLQADDDDSLYIAEARIFEAKAPILTGKIDFLKVEHLRAAAEALAKVKSE